MLPTIFLSSKTGLATDESSNSISMQLPTNTIIAMLRSPVAVSPENISFSKRIVPGQAINQPRSHDPACSGSCGLYLLDNRDTTILAFIRCGDDKLSIAFHGHTLAPCAVTTPVRAHLYIS